MCVSESGDGEKTIIGCFIGELRLEFANDLKKSIIRSENKRILLTETRNSLNYVEISKLFRLSLGFSHVAIYQWIKQFGEQVSTVKSKHSAKVVELDEGAQLYWA